MTLKVINATKALLHWLSDYTQFIGLEGRKNVANICQDIFFRICRCLKLFQNTMHSTKIENFILCPQDASLPPILRQINPIHRFSSKVCKTHFITVHLGLPIQSQAIWRVRGTIHLDVLLVSILA